MVPAPPVIFLTSGTSTCVSVGYCVVSPLSKATSVLPGGTSAGGTAPGVCVAAPCGGRVDGAPGGRRRGVPLGRPRGPHGGVLLSRLPSSGARYLGELEHEPQQPRRRSDREDPTFRRPGLAHRGRGQWSCNSTGGATGKFS